MLKKWNGKSGNKSWSDKSAPNGEDWSTLAQQLLLTQAEVLRLAKEIETLRTELDALKPKDKTGAGVASSSVEKK